MLRSFLPTFLLPYRLLVACLFVALVGAVWLDNQVTAGNQLLQASPLSPLQSEPLLEPTATSINEGSELLPGRTQTETVAPPLVNQPEVLPAPDAQPVRDPLQNSTILVNPSQVINLPLGEPLEAQTSLFLVGLVLVGLVALVITVVVRQRQP